jgi:hypothetical protein
VSRRELCDYTRRAWSLVSVVQGHRRDHALGECDRLGRSIEQLQEKDAIGELVELDRAALAVQRQLGIALDASERLRVVACGE